MVNWPKIEKHKNYCRSIDDNGNPRYELVWTYLVQICDCGMKEYNAAIEACKNAYEQEDRLVPLDEKEVFGIVQANNNTFVNDTDNKYIAKFICQRFGHHRVATVEEIEKLLESKFRMVEGITVCEGDEKYEHYINFEDLAKDIHALLTGEKIEKPK